MTFRIEETAPGRWRWIALDLRGRTVAVGLDAASSPAECQQQLIVLLTGGRLDFE